MDATAKTIRLSEYLTWMDEWWQTYQLTGDETLIDDIRDLERWAGTIKGVSTANMKTNNRTTPRWNGKQGARPKMRRGARNETKVMMRF